MIQDSDTRLPGKKKWKIWEVGPAWLGAIAALIAALTSAGFFAGRVTASSASAPLTVTVTQPALTVTVPASAVPQSSSASSSSPSVFYTGTRDLADGYVADLDNPNWAVTRSLAAGIDITLGNGFLGGYGGDIGILTTPVASDYGACAGFTAFASSGMPVSGLGVGTRLCVRTSEQRIGLLTVRGISGQDPNQVISFDVTVWNK